MAAIDSVAAPRSKTPFETFRTFTRTELFDRTNASDSPKRMEAASEAFCAVALPNPAHRRVDQTHRTAREGRTVECHSRGALPMPQNRRPAGEQRRITFRQPVEA